MVGFDINNKYVQISYYHPEKSEPESISATIGGDKFLIPFVLCKETDNHIWHYGNEAVKTSTRGKGILIEDILSGAINEKSILLEDKEYKYLDLLVLFLKKIIKLIGSVTDKGSLDTVAFTMNELDSRKRYILGKAIREISLTSTKFTINTYEDSFYYFMIHQKKELWSQGVLLFHWDEKELYVLHLHTNHKVLPKIASVTKNKYSNDELMSEITDTMTEEEKNHKYDVNFSEVVKKELLGRNISSVYLIGDFYNGDWMKHSLELLCRGRRVFRGNNLFVKGACYAAFENSKKTNKDRDEGEEIILISSESKKNKELENVINFNDENLKIKLLGDYYLGNNQYHKALLEYEKITNGREKEWDSSDLSSMWNNLGVAYGRLFLFNQAIQAFLHSYKIEQNEETAFNLICVVKLLEKEELEFVLYEHQDKELILSLINQLGERVDSLFQKEKEESKKAIIHMAENDRKDGRLGKSYDKLEKLLTEWKEEYRSFINEKIME